MQIIFILQVSLHGLKEFWKYLEVVPEMKKSKTGKFVFFPHFPSNNWI